MQLSIHLPYRDVHDVSTLLKKPENKLIVFFDELIQGYVVLTGQKEEISDCDIFLTVSIVPGDLIDNDPKYSSKSFEVYSTRLDKLIESGAGYQVYSFDVPMNYPKRKLNAPKIVFNAYIQTPEKIQETVNVSKLQKLVPVRGRNLLQELAITDEPIYLSNETLENNNLEITTKDLDHVLQQPSISVSTSLNLPIQSVLVIKLKSTKPAGKNNELLTSFNIEASEQLGNLEGLKIQLHKFDLHFNGKMEDMNADVYHFPVEFNINEAIVLNFKLVNNGEDQLKQIHLHLLLQILNADNTVFSSMIKTTWSPIVDFSLIAPPINNSLKTTAISPSLSKGPLTPSLLNRKTHSSPMLATNYRKLSSNSSVMVNLSSNSVSTNLNGLKVTFSGKLNIQLGEIVTWKVQAVNNSKTKLNLSLVTQNQVQIPVQLPASNIALASSLTPVYNKFQLQSIYKSLKLDKQGILILDTDVRIGPLEPNSVLETNIRIMGISKGIFNLDGLNIFDLGTGDGLDFGKLVEVFVT